TDGQFLIIGTGGIFNAEDVIKMMRQGASLVQIYSALVFEGPGLTQKLNKQLAHYLKSNGYNNVNEIIGLDVK
ncbi:dihydroorotate dehydrogenase (quinone), partial [Staphylococcus gallinarum]